MINKQDNIVYIQASKLSSTSEIANILKYELKLEPLTIEELNGKEVANIRDDHFVLVEGWESMSLNNISLKVGGSRKTFDKTSIAYTDLPQLGIKTVLLIPYWEKHMVDAVVCSTLSNSKFVDTTIVFNKEKLFNKQVRRTVRIF